MQFHIVFLLLALFSVLGAIYAAELNEVFRSSNGQSSPHQIPQPESAEITSADIAKWKRGINLGRKMMCQIDHRNCGSFNEAKRFYPHPKVNFNLLAELLKNLPAGESAALYGDDK